MPTLPLDTNGLRWFDTSPSAGDPDCICSHCDQVISGEMPLRLWNASGQEARLHQRCFAIRTGALVETEFVPTMDIDEVPDELGDLGACCACLCVGASVRNLVMLPVRAPVPGTGWGCVVCGLPNDGALAVVCDLCLDLNLEIVEAIDGYATKGQRVWRDTLTVPFDHRDIPH